MNTSLKLAAGCLTCLTRVPDLLRVLGSGPHRPSRRPQKCWGLAAVEGVEVVSLSQPWTRRLREASGILLHRERLRVSEKAAQLVVVPSSALSPATHKHVCPISPVCDVWVVRPACYGLT